MILLLGWGDFAGSGRGREGVVFFPFGFAFFFPAVFSFFSF